YKALTRELTFSDLVVGSPANLSIKIAHGFPRQQAMAVQIQIFKDSKIVFATEESTSLLDGGRTYILDFDEKWIPKAPGNYKVTIILSTSDKEINFDIQEKTITVTTSDLAGNIIGGIDDLFNTNPIGSAQNNLVKDANIKITENKPIDVPLQGIAITVLAIIVISGILIVLVKKKK
ncbi:MAG: hypothetical protein NUV57_02625, partial [archaeon]|nr:hypothetical protein [archaeon]